MYKFSTLIYTTKFICNSTFPDDNNAPHPVTRHVLSKRICILTVFVHDDFFTFNLIFPPPFIPPEDTPAQNTDCNMLFPSLHATIYMLWRTQAA